ncbi:aminodeoxychorismate lyase [Solimonas terrae]|uniref:Aminodeoxychorismate lyase n=1 Tax=Solimonas terrae TaxID=1396819 RepID=A0A6M2BWG3_9GAMM|nr:aminodeoxychorismate lyase [Solimonas terrae]NGY06319.1 aminodeoxychorismate lyase [Solimonas terrae]
MSVLIDGLRVDRIAADSRGLAYGDGVFRTLLVHAGAVVHIDDHLAALAADAARLELEMPDAALWQAESLQLCAGQAWAVLKWLLVRRSLGRGYRAATRAAQRIVQLAPLPAPVSPRPAAVAAISDFRLAVQPALAGIKHLNRLEQVWAARDLRDGLDELLMCDHDGHLVGGLRSNLFAVRDGRLLTPAVDRCGVAGTLRARVMRLAAQLGIDCDIVREPPSRLTGCSELFVTNALIGIWPLCRLDERELGAPGPVTARLARELGHPFSL